MGSQNRGRVVLINLGTLCFRFAYVVRVWLGGEKQTLGYYGRALDYSVPMRYSRHTEVFVDLLVGFKDFA
jgi:hypothetical protein